MPKHREIFASTANNQPTDYATKSVLLPRQRALFAVWAGVVVVCLALFLTGFADGQPLAQVTAGPPFIPITPPANAMPTVEPTPVPETSDAGLVGVLGNLLRMLLLACLGGALVIGVVIIWMLAIWGFRDRLKTEKFLKALSLWIFSPLILVLRVILQFILTPIYILVAFVVLLLAGPVLIFWHVIKRLRQLILLGTVLWQAKGKQLYSEIENFGQDSRAWHKQSIHVVIVHALLLTTNRFTSRFFSQKDILEYLLRIFSNPNIAITLVAVARDEAHSVEQRNTAIDGLEELALLYVQREDGRKVEEIEKTLLQLVHDTALPTMVRVHTAMVLTRHAQRTFPIHPIKFFNQSAAYQAWKGIAEDRSLEGGVTNNGVPIPVAVIRVGALNVIRKNLGLKLNAQKSLGVALLAELNDNQNGDPEFNVRAASLYEEMLWIDGDLTGQGITIPRKTLYQYTTCEECTAKVQYLATFAIGKFVQESQAGPLLLRLAQSPDASVREKAVAGLGRFNCENSLKELADKDIWKSGANLKVRMAAIKQLAACDLQSAINAWGKIMADKTINLEVRIQAASQSLEKGCEKAHQFLLQIGARHAEEYQFQVAQELARCGYQDDALSIYLLLARNPFRRFDIARKAFGELLKLV